MSQGIRCAMPAAAGRSKASHLFFFIAAAVSLAVAAQYVVAQAAVGNVRR